MPLRIVRHLGWLLRHHSHNGSTASSTRTTRPATIAISTYSQPTPKASPPAETPPTRS